MIEIDNNTYDDEAMNIFLLKGVHYPTIILDNAVVVVQNDTTSLDFPEAKRRLMHEIYAQEWSQKGIIIFYHIIIDKLVRISYDRKTGIAYTTILN